MTITPTQLRESAARQRAASPDGATVPLADELDAAAAEIECLSRPATWPEEQIGVEAAFERSGVTRPWPADEPDNLVPMADAMADEIARLRLTAAEREAIEEAIKAFDEFAGDEVYVVALRTLLERTPPTQPTPGECSKPREGTSEPVAWWVRGCEYDTGCEYEFVTLLKEQAELAATNGGKAVPLYQSPSLTDAEREAVEIAVEYVGSAFQVEHHAAVLRGLLERLA